MSFLKAKSYSLLRILSYLLKQLDVKVTDNNLNQILDERKKYKGSIRGIREVLNDLEIESNIYRLDYNDLLGIECPFVAHIEENTPYFVVLNKCSEETVSYFSSTKGHINESVPEFLKKWSGVVLVPLTSQQSGDPDYKKNLKVEKKTKRET